ncbi:MAG: type I restriction enzyme HsdR N-terminal domain-containing protein, partial [Cyanobacteria bacterium P01_F01_bin.116]
SIDVLVLQNQLWVTVIEAKNSEFSITKAIPQTLAYMLAAPNPPAFGLVLNGSEFLFLKVMKTETPDDDVFYSRSNLFSLLNQGNDLYTVLQVLKQLGQLAISSPS